MQINLAPARRASILAAASSLLLASATSGKLPAGATPATTSLERQCRPEAVQAIASSLGISGLTIRAIGTLGAPSLPGGVRFTPASADRQAYCQVSGSFVTNPAKGKTANFLATFPEKWNGKYLQLGCSSLCGQLFVSDPATPSITVTAQGHPWQIINKGYAAFATDEGHETRDPKDWALDAQGDVDPEELLDLYNRANRLLAPMGKAFSRSFYAAVNGTRADVSRSYFSGCSGGGRDAFVAASLFPEEFDGIIGGSPYNYFGVSFLATAISAASARSPDASVPASLMRLVDPIVKASCDGLDGLEDGIVQNPAACDFRAERDLPICKPGSQSGQCFTKAQAETVSVILSGVTDERGNVVQPGFSVSELEAHLEDGLGEPVTRYFVHRNPPGFSSATRFTFRRGGPGPVQDFHAVVSSAEVDKARAELRWASGDFPEDADKLVRLDRKFLIWANFSDNGLTPYTAINYYKKLAARHGGYGKTERNVRLFMLPGTSHCSITSVAPNGFDPLTAMEDWVERNIPPERLVARVAQRQFSPGQSRGPAADHPDWTMPLCKFPIRARYSGRGDPKDASNWTCPAGDRSMLVVGPSGRQAGVLDEAR